MSNSRPGKKGSKINKGVSNLSLFQWSRNLPAMLSTAEYFGVDKSSIIAVQL